VHGERSFRYEIDFNQLVLDESSSALCVSRPTNPSGNVLSRADMERLGELADAHNIPLIVDCAYGAPFPNLVYEGEALPWQKNRIFVMSLSKLGLPGARTGIVVADRTLIKKLSSANTVLSLASGNLGPALLTQILKAKALDEICRDVLFPFYRRKREEVLSLISTHLEDLPYKVHDADGAFFVWLWFDGLPISSADLYQRLKDRGVLVMDGEHFFCGQFEEWSHSKECLRLSYCAETEALDRALYLLSEELRALAW
jgi:valine--pyruvate aminotransferase